jgi:membrane protease YdiL (CAAX protease family)
MMALGLFGAIVAFVLGYYSFTNPIFPDPLRIAPAPANDLVQALLVALLSLIPFIASLFLRKQPVKSLGWNPAMLSAGLQMGFAIAVFTVFLRGKFMTILGGVPADKFLPLIFALGIALAEETIFRGYIQLRLAWWLGPVPGIALTAALSTLYHLPIWLFRLPANTILILAALTFIQALVLGWIMRKAGHVAAPAIYRAFAIWMTFL